MCGPWRKAAEMGIAHSVTPERVLSEYNKDLIILICDISKIICPENVLSNNEF